MAQQQIAKQLKDEGIKVDDNIMSGLVNLMNECNLEGDDLVAEWQSFAMKKKNAVHDESHIDQSAFRVFSKHLRVSQSARCPKKTRSRSNNFGVHNNQSLQPLMEKLSTPSRSSHPPRRQSAAPLSGGKIKNNDDLFNSFLSMQTPSKSTLSSSMNSSSQSAVKSNPNRGRTASLRSDPIATPSLMQSPAPSSRTSTHSNTATKGKRSGDKVIETVNAQIPIDCKAAPSSIRMEVIVPAMDGTDYPFNVVAVEDLKGGGSDLDNAKRQRFMMEDVDSKQFAMRERIEYIGHFLKAQIRREDKDRLFPGDGGKGKEDDDDDDGGNGDVVVFSDLDSASQRECYFLGRLITDGDDGGNLSDKMTAGNVMMESVDGRRVKLNLTALESMALFPGQIVAVRGLNSSGKEVMASRIFQKAALMERVGSNAMNGGHGDSDEVVQMVIACGPFTGRESVQFEGSTMHDLAKTVNVRRPNVVVLMGPFTDSENPLIKKGEIDVSWNELFEHLLSAFLEFVDVDGVQIVVLPSTKDVHHFSAFPQHRYRWRSRERANVHFVPNPAELRLNNVRMGLCSVDLLFDLIKIGSTKNIKDRLLSLMTHCIDQQSFYPLHPPSRALRVRMDYNEHRSLYIHDKLDLLIMPSNLKHFAKIDRESNTLCINPSFLTRMNRGGTYAVLHIADSNCYDVDDYTQRIRCDIFRI